MIIDLLEISAHCHQQWDPTIGSVDTDFEHEVPRISLRGITADRQGLFDEMLETPETAWTHYRRVLLMGATLSHTPLIDEKTRLPNCQIGFELWTEFG